MMMTGKLPRPRGAPARSIGIGLALAAAGLSSSAAVAQRDLPPSGLDGAVKKSVVQAIVRRLEEAYVRPAMVPAIVAAITTPEDRYGGVATGPGFADSLTADLRRASGDRHLLVELTPEAPPDGGDPEVATARRRESAEFAKYNYGIRRVERLRGNVGYLELRAFVPSTEAETAIAAAMTLVSHTDALIIDLRENQGGTPAAVAFVASYLLDRPVHLSSLFRRLANRTDEFWTRAKVPGGRFGARRPAFVLTSHSTFSAGEAFAYHLQALHRVVVVGEETAGGANAGSFQPVGGRFRLFVPSSRAINPVTGTNWERTGVIPDRPVPAADALHAAHVAALDTLLRAEKDPASRTALEKALTALRTGGPNSGKDSETHQ